VGAREAEDKSASELDGLLPDCPAIPDHYHYSVEDQFIPVEIGILWISPRHSSVGRSVWIYDSIVHEKFRRRGYASRILHLAEDRARELGAVKIELHVFGHNHVARALYEKTGYRPTDIVLSNPLTAEANQKSR
jgi:RimJ/RimL family protein N-acetyltransferase